MSPRGDGDPDPVYVRDGLDTDQDLIEHHRDLARRESENYRGAVPESSPGSNIHCFVAGFGDSDLASMMIAETTPGRWRIDHVFVEAEAREIGIGDALVRHALGWMVARGASWVEASALPGDRSMKNLFERHGLVAQTITVGRALSDPSTVADASR